jgi:hypothetical protein
VEVRSGDKISVQVKDNGVGVDKDSITITVDGAPAKPTITPLAGGLKDYAVSLNLPVPEKLEQDKVVVAVDAKDLHDPPNAMATETHTFPVTKVHVSPPFDFEAFWKEYAADFPERQKFREHYLSEDDMKWYTSLRLAPVRIEPDKDKPYSRLEDEGDNVVFRVKFKAFFRTFAGLQAEPVDEVWVINAKTRKIVEVRKPPGAAVPKFDWEDFKARYEQSFPNPVEFKELYATNCGPHLYRPDQVPKYWYYRGTPEKAYEISGVPASRPDGTWEVTALIEHKFTETAARKVATERWVIEPDKGPQDKGLIVEAEWITM